MAEVLAHTRLPFRAVTDPLFPKLPAFMDQFKYAKECLVWKQLQGVFLIPDILDSFVSKNRVPRRYMIYGIQGPSQAAKTSFAKQLFQKPFVVTVQNSTTLNLKDFVYGHHDALCFGKSWQLFLRLNDTCQKGASPLCK